jgi:hypothetical protein
MADMEGGFSVELVGSPNAGASALHGWAVIHHGTSVQRRVVSVYLTIEQAEIAAERLRKEAGLRVP